MSLLPAGGERAGSYWRDIVAEPVCVISGVGPGTGAALSRRFAEAGYRVAMLARNGERLSQ